MFYNFLILRLRLWSTAEGRSFLGPNIRLRPKVKIAPTVQHWSQWFYILKIRQKLKKQKQKKIMRAVQKLPAKQHSQSSPIWVKMGWIVYAIYLAGNFQTAPNILFISSGQIFSMISSRTHKPEMPANFCHLIFQLQAVCIRRLCTLGQKRDHHIGLGLNNSHAKVENHVKTGCHNIWFMHH